MIDIERLLMTDDGTPFFFEYPAPDINEREILRYSTIPSSVAVGGFDCADEELGKLIEEVRTLMNGEFTYRVACSHISFDGDNTLNDDFRRSTDLMTNLKGCNDVIVFAATVGSGIDRMIRRYERLKPATALLLQAYGAERVESLCDAFDNEISEGVAVYGYRSHPRYSPGFGDLGIEVQPKILNMLDAGRKLGITLNASYLMSPSKSVTAVIGLERV